MSSYMTVIQDCLLLAPTFSEPKVLCNHIPDHAFSGEIQDTSIILCCIQAVLLYHR